MLVSSHAASNWRTGQSLLWRRETTLGMMEALFISTCYKSYRAMKRIDVLLSLETKARHF